MSTPTRNGRSVSDELDQKYNKAAYILNADENVAIPSQRMTLKTALLKVGFAVDEVYLNRHRKAVKRRRDKLKAAQYSLPAVINISSPTNLSTVTNSSVRSGTATATTASSTVDTNKKKSSVNKTRRRKAQVVSDNVDFVTKKRKENESFFAAMKEYKEQKEVPKLQRRSAFDIVNEINKRNDTNISAITLRRKIHKGTEDSAPGRERHGVLNRKLRDALLSGLRSYIVLQNSGRSTMPNTATLIKTLELVIKPHSSQKDIKQIRKLFSCLMRDISEDINVLTTNSKMEKRRLLWSTYNNINTWFSLLKK